MTMATIDEGRNSVTVQPHYEERDEDVLLHEIKEMIQALKVLYQSNRRLFLHVMRLMYHDLTYDEATGAVPTGFAMLAFADEPFFFAMLTVRPLSAEVVQEMAASFRRMNTGKKTEGGRERSHSDPENRERSRSLPAIDRLPPSPSNRQEARAERLQVREVAPWFGKANRKRGKLTGTGASASLTLPLIKEAPAAGAKPSRASCPAAIDLGLPLLCSGEVSRVAESATPLALPVFTRPLEPGNEYDLPPMRCRGSDSRTSLTPLGINGWLPPLPASIDVM